MKEKLFEILQEVDIIAFNDWLATVLEEISFTDIKPIRAGQHLFNKMYETYPNVADFIRGTELDMFYVDSKIQDFIILLDEFINKYTKNEFLR